MKYLLILAPFFSFAQLHHQALSACGGASRNGIYSVGQSSVIGNLITSRATVSQGFVNPTKVSYALETITTELIVTIYPNPFVKYFTTKLDKKYKNIQVFIHNVAGQLLYIKNFSNTSKVVVDTPKLNIQTYLITILADKKMFNAKLIKK